MEKRKLTNTYQAPKITVVTFKIEDGFTSLEGKGTESFEQNGNEDQGSLFVPFS